MSTYQYELGKVSVIIPTYNYSKFLPLCLKSVFEQDYQDIEVIVVDDGSTDDTKTVLEPFMDRIQYIFQENEHDRLAH